MIAEHGLITLVYTLYRVVPQEILVLAYDFAPRGSLHDILHEQEGIGSSSNPNPALTWSQRIQIALGVARGLCYIHNYCWDLVHHNIRSNNVLLCDDETAMIIDPLLWTQCQSCRTISYKECHPNLLNAHNQKCDIYSFGEVLLELLTGSKIVDNTLRAGQPDLMLWQAFIQLDSDRWLKLLNCAFKIELQTCVELYEISSCDFMKPNDSSQGAKIN
ncbi:pto-interacting protein 1-like [Salvia hispanica]|uniref:pto-interacting protein 1-like n=1 Tax=Salvia hispanica TaxID=49212 RepID=UPI0020099F58|nr:pto-interacting protein 1-like [Salvia hispanica]